MQHLSLETTSVVEEAEALLSQWQRAVITHTGLSTAEQTKLRHRILDVCVAINKVGACEVSFVGQSLEVRVASRDANLGIDAIVNAAHEAVGSSNVTVQVF